MNGQIQYKCQNADSYPRKTTYDPNGITDAQFNSMAKNAANKIWSDGVSVNYFLNKYPNPKSKTVQYFGKDTRLKYEGCLNFDIKANMPYIGTIYLAK